MFDSVAEATKAPVLGFRTELSAPCTAAWTAEAKSAPEVKLELVPSTPIVKLAEFETPFQ